MRALLLMVSGCLLPLCNEASGQSTPNIVYIIADDMGFGDIRSYNPTSPVNTPNLDRIANAGMRFTNAHAPSSICTPTRYGILTGQYGWRTSLQSGALLPYQPALISPSRTTLAEMLQASGYSTGAFGKWHLGMNWVTTTGAPATLTGSNVNHAMPFTGGPLDNGFDTYFGVDAVNYPPYAFIRDRNTVGNDLVTPTSPTGIVNGNPASSSNSPGPIVSGFNIVNTLPTVTSEALSYISSKANQANPFFAYIPLTAPHEPILPPGSASGQSGVVGPKQAYGDFLWTVDSVVGQVLDTLANPDGNPNTADSVLDNTLVVFTADNGVASQWGFPTSAGTVNGTPLRGDKSTIYEGGTRVPFLAQWTGQVPAGSVNNHMVQLNDLMATVASVTGYALPTNAAEDSLNIMPELTGNAVVPVRTTGVTHSYQGAFAIRQIDGANNEWKLIFTAGNGGLGDSQIVSPLSPITNFNKLQLYNLTSDPGEQINLLSGGGSPAAQQKALQLQEELHTYIYSGRSSGAALPFQRSQPNDNVFQVDFGESSRQTPGVGWNNVSGTFNSFPAVTLGMYDQGGTPAQVFLSTSWIVSGSSPGGVDTLANAYNGPYPAELNGIPSTALSDNFYIRNGNKLILTLAHLDADATYDFLFYGSCGVVGPEYSLFTVIGTTTQQAFISPVTNNATQVATVDGVVPNEYRQIVIEFEGRWADGTVGGGGRLGFMRMIEHLLEIPGDYNNDRQVDAADYATWRSAFGTVGANPADGNHDGVVDAGDYVIWRHALANWNAGAGAGFGHGVSAVPEPSSLLLTAIGLIGLFATSRRRRDDR
jgi:arylsulfatase A-like enzyme